MRRLLVVSGLPASGKTTLGKHLSEQLGFPFFDKDDFLERLFDNAVAVDPNLRNQFSRRADVEFEEAVKKAGSAVAASWWRHPKSTTSSGAVPWWLGDTGATVAEVHCVCPPEVAVARFMARSRHPGHNDSRWSRAKLLAFFADQTARGAHCPTHAILCNTESPATVSQIDHIAKAVVARFDAESAA